jgi:GntP family gluconate:H+ symporter
MSPLIILLIGIILVVGMIVVLKVNAFVSLITSAMVISLLAPGNPEDKIVRVAREFGSVAGSIGIVIALAAVIGKCLMDSGAADRIVRSFLRLLGEKRAPAALMASGFVLSIPVFFDTVFYLLVPLARSLWRRTRKNYVLYITAIGTGASITHTLVPPTPGPLFIASTFGIDLGLMIIVGLLIGVPSALLAMLACVVINRLNDLPMRPYANEAPGQPPPEESAGPGLFVSVLPVIFPVLLISANTVSKAMKWTRVTPCTDIIGNPNLALLFSAAIAMAVLFKYRRLTLRALGRTTEEALLSGAVIVLITAAGGAFGAMLRACEIQSLMDKWISPEHGGAGFVILLSAFAMSSVLKFAQGSSTVAMITTATTLSAMGLTPQMLGFNLVYLAAVIAGGSVVGGWMNDSGFWVVARMSGLTEVETLKTFSIAAALTGCGILIFSLLFAWLLPLV